MKIFSVVGGLMNGWRMPEREGNVLSDETIVEWAFVEFHQSRQQSSAFHLPICTWRLLILQQRPSSI